MKKILFVCTGNTCRSPMAEVILKAKIKNAGVKGVRVSSAGLSAETGGKMSKNSITALKNLGYAPRGFKSKPADAKTLLSSDLIVCMTAEHKNRIKNFPGTVTVKELTGFCDISDPYGAGLDEYVKTSHEIEDVCNIIVEKIISGELWTLPGSDKIV